MKKPGVLNINVPNQHKTSLAEAGIFDLQIDSGDSVVALGHCYFPDHDRSLFDGIVFPALRKIKPRAIFLLGGGIHDDSFQDLAPKKANNRKVAVHTHPAAPELAAVQESCESFEEKTNTWGKVCGNFISSLADAGDSQVFYIPSASPMLPNESEIMRFIYYTKKRIDEWWEKHPEEAPEEPETVPTTFEDYNKLLGVEDNDRVTVLPFGSAVLVNERNLFMVGDFRRRNPVTAGNTEFLKRHLNIVRGFDGKLADGWFTTASQSLPNERQYWQFHEVPNLMDSTRMGYLRDYDYWSQGLFKATFHRDMMHGCSFPALRGTDKVRRVVIDGQVYQEASTGAGRGKRGVISMAARKSR